MREPITVACMTVPSSKRCSRIPSSECVSGKSRLSLSFSSCGPEDAAPFDMSASHLETFVRRAVTTAVRYGRKPLMFPECFAIGEKWFRRGLFPAGRNVGWAVSSASGCRYFDRCRVVCGVVGSSRQVRVFGFHPILNPGGNQAHECDQQGRDRENRDSEFTHDELPQRRGHEDMLLRHKNYVTIKEYRNSANALRWRSPG